MARKKKVETGMLEVPEEELEALEVEIAIVKTDPRGSYMIQRQYREVGS